MEKVVPQPVHSGRPAQSTAVSLEGPDQVLLGLGAAEGWVQQGLWEAGAPGLSAHACLSVCPHRQVHRSLGTVALRPQVRPQGSMALQRWG